ncbi:DUF3307 domain-containing protein [Pectobacterium brasiliense]|uniref:DUF3307 domain-containing protein n=1 Tax=Pectobacterium brasiliense TaxID=180957 RepID=UPI001969407D|nr:DUF3307 domain-containing protein [Pectobacterium brasiliense]
MYYLFTLMILAHFISDFYLQTDSMVEKKEFNASWSCKFYLYHITHGLIHLAVWMAAGLFFLYTIRLDLFPKTCHLLYVGGVITALHIFIDIGKEYLKFKYQNRKFWILISEQFLHILIILAGILMLSHYCGFVVTKLQITMITPILQALMILLGMVFLLKPTSTIVMHFLELSMSEGGVKRINITRSHLAKIFDEKFNKNIGDLVTKDNLTKEEVYKKIDLFKENTDIITSSLSDKKDNLQVDVSKIFSTNNAGKWIGYIERIMIFIFYISGQFTAIAAVMAIKTAFRFNDLKDDNDSQRSEYIMLGTFFSLFITIISSVCIKHFMNIEHFKEVIIIYRATFM